MSNILRRLPAAIIAAVTLIYSPYIKAQQEFPTTVFSRPGVRFMQKFPYQKDGNEIKVTNLPYGLNYNENRNLVEGVINIPGEYIYYVDITDVEGNSKTTPISLTVSDSLQQALPFMGWLSWNVIEGNVSHEVVTEVADALVEKGLKDAGYNYLVIDDLWHAPERNADYTPKEDSVKFPLGMRATSDYVHKKGLKFGIYSDAAYNTCAGAFGSFGYEKIDAKQYADWGVDILKYDYCHAPVDLPTAVSRYQAMGDALRDSGRNIVLYICEWGVREPWKWGAETGGSCWRCTYDTRDCWYGDEANNGIGIAESINHMKDLWIYNGVNRWNDADMMCVGIHGKGKSSSELCISSPGMNHDEYATQFALWCMWSSPLTLSFDVREEISEDDMAIITNRELIALNQDPMGQAAQPVETDNPDFIVFTKDLENGDIAVSVTNITETPGNYTVDLTTIPGFENNSVYALRDVVNHRDISNMFNFNTLNTDIIPSHGTVVYRFNRRQ